MFFFFTSLLCPLLCIASVEQCPMVPAATEFEYRLIDLGPTDIKREYLSKYALPNNYAPMVNNQRQVAYNQSDQGYLRSVGSSTYEIAPQISRINTFCHGLNDSEKLLLTFERSPSDIFWGIWALKGSKKVAEQRIAQGDVSGRHIHLRALGNGGMAVGILNPGGMWRPLVWTPEEGLHHLGYYLGWDITGVLWGVNSKNTVLGYLKDGEKEIPFVWNKQWGLERLTSLNWQWRRETCRLLEGEVRFADAVIAEDDRVFGTFLDASKKLHSFWWDPHASQIRPIDLKGMRINAINSSYTLVGYFENEAALCDFGAAPVYLKGLISEDLSHWKLLEASDINDLGDIVGYGTHDGEMHYFLLLREKRR